MRIESFFIGHHRVLHNLQLDFARTPEPLLANQKYALDFIVGVNGTGKSTALQLLGMVFAHLHRQTGTAYRFPIPIDLKYVLQRPDREVRIRLCNIRSRVETTSDDENTADDSLPTLHYQKDGSAWHDGAQGPLLAEDLPHLVIYSTGRLSDWRQAINTPIDTELLDSGSDVNAPQAQAFEWPGHRPFQRSADSYADPQSTRLTFIEPDRLELVTLCGLIADRWGKEERRLQYVLEEAQVKALSGFSLRIRYHEGLNHPEVKARIDDLRTIATRVLRQGADWLLIFELPQDQVDTNGKKIPFGLGDRALFGKLYSTPLQMFEALYALYEHSQDADCPLRQVSLFLQRPTSKANDGRTPMLHLYRWLSDGEQSLLARMALLSLFRRDNLLIFLDEPEVHFNDVWKREIINVLDKVMSGNTSHTLIATHSSIALTDVPRDDILVFHRNGEYTSQATKPTIQTFGADPSDVLVHVFGTPSASGERSVSYIQQEIGTRRTGDRLTELEEIVAPGYWRYRIQLEKQRLRVLGIS